MISSSRRSRSSNRAMANRSSHRSSRSSSQNNWISRCHRSGSEGGGSSSGSSSTLMLQQRSKSARQQQLSSYASRSVAQTVATSSGKRARLLF